MPDEPSIYRSAEAEAEVSSIYDGLLADWPVPFDLLSVPTRYGEVAVVASGPGAGAPVLALHASSMAATSWRPNIRALVDAGFRVLAPDYIGEAGRSRLGDLSVFPKTGRQIGELQTEIADGLGVGPVPVIAASAGGHAALRFALAAPERVERLALLGPMGIVPLGLRAALRMTAVNMFPKEARVARTTRWAIGSAAEVVDQYGPWFSAVLRSIATPPRVGRPVALKPDEMRRLAMPVLLVLGNRDNLVGDPLKAARRAASFPDVDVRILESGHLIGVERAAEVDRLLVRFLRGEALP
jgi:pimeloyl-ACP methyl ester carboxylesterase